MSDEKPKIEMPRPVVALGDASEVEDHKDDIFFAAIELTRMPMLVTDPRQEDNPIVFANRAFVMMSGYSLDELLGRNCRFLQGPATDKDTVSAVREAIAQKEEIALEILNYRKDGSTFWNALFVSPVFNRAGELVYFFASQLDVSRRRDAEEALAQAQKMEALGQLTGGISHDFNNLLQVMSGHLELIKLRHKAGLLEGPALEASIQTVQASVTKASTLTQQLLAFSRKQKLQGRVVNLNKTAKGMSSMIERTIGEAISVEYDLDPMLPNCQLDNTQLEVALLNLLVNARDAMPQGGTIRIETRAADVRRENLHALTGLPPGEYASICVSDTGCGIPPEIVGRVMEPFFTTKEEGKGTGLGLATVYGFAKQSGGTATIYSEVGIGTSVRMYFPAARSELMPEKAEPPQQATLRGGDEWILVVDDRIEIAELAGEMLRSLGYRVWAVHSGVEALKLMRETPPNDRPDMLFSDIVMPGGINGYVLAQEIRKLSPGIQILLTTGFDRDMGRLEPLSSSEFDVIKKPYKLEDLARRVRMILDGATGARA